MLYYEYALAINMSGDVIENPFKNEAWDSIVEKNLEALTMISGPLAMANQFAQTMANATNANLNVRVPLGAEEWAENIFERYFELVGKIAKESGVRRSLLDRDMYDARLPDSPYWASGLTLEDIPHPIEDEDYGTVDDSPEVLEELYGPLGFDRRSLTFMNKIEGTLSGQYNRLFPVKIVLRVAANLISTRDEYKLIGEDGENIEYDELHLEELRLQCLKVAGYAKERFKFVDRRSGSNMGERLAVGLPDKDGDAKKVKKQAERFVSQFVGSVRNKGQGLPFELGLLSIDDDGTVQFTENGVRFMLMKNPLFDSQRAWKDGESFSNEEKVFLIRMIQRNVPDEFDLMIKILTHIDAGKNSPKPLEEALVEEFNVSKTESSLMRSGVLARMIELSLVNREQTGRNVNYELTETGLKLLKIHKQSNT